ncbi:MAG: FHA domain-containing protein [Muribaculaceae bacterium]|nr:FHA domain-containing protein [Muribaculaceae bacterium]
MKLIIVGSAPDVHVKYNSPYVSSYHAELLLLDNGDILLTDKASRNGTFVNDTRISPNKEVTVKRGDNIRFADVALDWNSIPLQQNLQDVKEIRGIGTNFRNKYLLQGDKVSRFHATLKLKKDGKWYIQDHSKNGTTVNGIPLSNNQEIQLKKGDKIFCAGVEVPNPYTGKSGQGNNNGRAAASNLRKWIFGGIGVAAVIAIIIGCLTQMKNCTGTSPDTAPKEMSDVQLYAKYKSAIVLMRGYYYYKITAGNLDLTSLGLPTEVIIAPNGKLMAVDKNRDNMYSYTGTGFFVSPDGKIVTNLHIARPWLFDDNSSKISDAYKQMLAQYASEIPQLNAFIGQIKVEGVSEHLGFIPNGEYFTEENITTCRELAASNDINADVALLQSTKRKLPEADTSYVNLEEAIIADKEIHVGEHIYTMGFPLGLKAQDLNSSSGIQLLARGGNITQESNEYSFGFDAASYGGASGSPIFNSKGQLVGILNAGFNQSQGFNYGIKAIYATELYNQTLRQ